MKHMLWPLLAAAALAGCNTNASGGRTAAGRGDARGQAISVRTVKPERISVQRRIELSGTLLSPDQAKVSSEVGGVVREVSVELGSEVRPGSQLIRLDTSELVLALERAESALRQVEAQLGMNKSAAGPAASASSTSAKGAAAVEGEAPVTPPEEQMASVRQALANRDDARAAHARALQLSARGLLSPVDRETTETRLKVAEANYEAAIDTARSLKATLQDRRAAYELAKKKLADAIVRAPIPGSISERFVQPGEFISQNALVATIVQMDPLKLRTGVQEKFAGAIRPGQTAQFSVEAFPGRVFEGKVAFVSPSVDQALRTFTVELFVDNGQRLLKPGFFAKGTIDIRLDEQVMAVSDEALSTMAGVSSVFVVKDNKTRQQRVTTGAHQGKLWEVTDGLKGDEMLASSNLNQLATGTAVRVDGDAPANGARPGKAEAPVDNGAPANDAPAKPAKSGSE